MSRVRIRRPLLALIALVLALLVGYVVRALDSGDSGGPATSAPPLPSATASPIPGRPAPSSPSAAGVPLSSLPRQAAATVRLIAAGGPFPYPRNDGVVFHNAERHLPRERDGYYREYTVPTPGSPDRGARRIVTGAPGEFWYTGDHYEHFVRVDVTR